MIRKLIKRKARQRVRNNLQNRSYTTAVFNHPTLQALQFDVLPIATNPIANAEHVRARKQTQVGHLALPKPHHYVLAAGDTLGIFIDGIYGDFDSNPPVQFPADGSDLAPALGFPVPISLDGTIDLPHVAPITLAGLTVEQAERRVVQMYRNGSSPILKAQHRIIVTLLRKRTHGVTVIRGDHRGSRRRSSVNTNRAATVSQRSDRSALGTRLQLPEQQNDVLNALLLTGGLPGINARSEIRVQRGSIQNQTLQRRPSPYLEFPRSAGPNDPVYHNSPSRSRTLVTRLDAGAATASRIEDAELRSGDIVHVDARSTEVYFTGGLLGGGEHLLPRDYDLDVLQAVARSGTALGHTGNNRLSPTDLVILRRRPGHAQIILRVDLDRAISDPRHRILVAPGDTLLLRHKPAENIGNFGIDLFLTLGVRQLFGR